MNRTSSRTGLFLMELILAVLFFSLAGAVCIRLFVNSHLISQKSVELNHGVLWTQNVAETFYAYQGECEEMAALFPESELSPSEDGSETLTLFFDEDFTPIRASEEAPAYQLTARISQAKEHLLTCRITFLRTIDQATVYQLEPSLFTGKEASHD